MPPCSMAAAHERLPHLQAEHMMVSCTGCYGEGWQWVDALDNVCQPPVRESALTPAATGAETESEQYSFYPGHEMPVFLHYCQSFKVKAWGKSHDKRKGQSFVDFYKRDLNTELFDFSEGGRGCSSDLFEIPPSSTGDRLSVPKDATKVQSPSLAFSLLHMRIEYLFILWPSERSQQAAVRSQGCFPVLHHALCSEQRVVLRSKEALQPRGREGQLGCSPRFQQSISFYSISNHRWQFLSNFKFLLMFPPVAYFKFRSDGECTFSGLLALVKMYKLS